MVSPPRMGAGAVLDINLELFSYLMNYFYIYELFTYFMHYLHIYTLFLNSLLFIVYNLYLSLSLILFLKLFKVHILVIHFSKWISKQAPVSGE